jgi:hypothetical protein
LPDPMRLEPMSAPDALNGTDADAGRLGHRRARPMRRSCGGSSMVRATIRSAKGLSFGMREGRVLSRSSPSTPSAAKRSCQRQTQVLDLPVSRMITFVPTPSALSNMICARQTCFCGALRSLTRAHNRVMSARGDGKGNPSSHAPDSHTASPPGIPIGIQMSHFIH